MGEYEDFIASLSQTAEIENHILKGDWSPSIAVAIPIPLELKELLRLLDSSEAYNLLEFGLRYALPIVTNNRDNKSLIILEWLDMYIKYFKLYKIQPYINTLSNVMQYLARDLAKELHKYDLNSDMISIVIDKDKPIVNLLDNNFICRHLDVLVYNTHTDPETGEWAYYG